MDLVEPDEPVVVILTPAQWREVFGAVNRGMIEGSVSRGAWSALFEQLEGKITPA